MGLLPPSRLQAISKDSDIAFLSGHQIPVTLQLGMEPQDHFLRLCCKFNGFVLVRSCVGNQCCCELMCAIVMLHAEDIISQPFDPSFSSYILSTYFYTKFSESWVEKKWYKWSTFGWVLQTVSHQLDQFGVFPINLHPLGKEISLIKVDNSINLWLYIIIKEIVWQNSHVVK